VSGGPLNVLHEKKKKKKKGWSKENPTTQFLTHLRQHNQQKKIMKLLPKNHHIGKKGTNGLDLQKLPWY